MVGIRAPRLVPAEMREMLLRGLHHIGGRALRTLHFTDGLLGKDRREVGLRDGGNMAGRGEAETIAEAKRFFQSKNCWLRQTLIHAAGL